MIKPTKEQLINLIEDGYTKSYLRNLFEFVSTKQFDEYLQSFEIDDTMFTNTKHQQYNGKYRKLTDYIQEAGNNASLSEVRKKLLKEGYKKNECEICGLKEWGEFSIPLDVHHKDENHFNNSIDNLMLICPNCHAVIHRRDREYKKWKKPSQINFCIDCGKEIWGNSTRCKECSDKNQANYGINQEITREQLKNMIRTKSFLQIGKELGISDNGVRKWCDKFGLPRRKQDINRFSDKQWEAI